MIAGPAPIHPGTFPLDPSFPQLAVACDAARMREVFRTHLKPVPGASVRIVECAPFRFRCRQSTARCVLQYKLRLEEPLTGRQRDLFATGLIYAEPGEAERLWRSLAAEHPAPEIPAQIEHAKMQARWRLDEHARSAAHSPTVWVGEGERTGEGGVRRR